MKLILFITSILVTLLSVSPIYANENPTTNKRVEKEMIKRDAIRPKVEEKRTEFASRLSAVKKERVMSFSNKLVVRLEATTERLQKLADRIEERINKIEEENQDTDTESLKQKLDTAKEILAQVKVDLESLKEALYEVPSSDEPKLVFEEVRALTEKIKENLKTTHSTLVELIREIKGLRIGENKQ